MHCTRCTTYSICLHWIGRRRGVRSPVVVASSDVVSVHGSDLHFQRDEVPSACWRCCCRRVFYSPQSFFLGRVEAAAQPGETEMAHKERDAFTRANDDNICASSGFARSRCTCCNDENLLHARHWRGVTVADWLHTPRRQQTRQPCVALARYTLNTIYYYIYVCYWFLPQPPPVGVVGVAAVFFCRICLYLWVCESLCLNKNHQQQFVAAPEAAAS